MHIYILTFLLQKFIVKNDTVSKMNSIDNNHTFLKNVKDICFKPSTFIKGLVFCWGDKREVFTKQSVVSQLRRSFMYWRTIALVFRFRNTFFERPYIYFNECAAATTHMVLPILVMISKYNANKTLQWYLLE